MNVIVLQLLLESLPIRLLIRTTATIGVRVLHDHPLHLINIPTHTGSSILILDEGKQLMQVILPPAYCDINHVF